PAEERFRQTFLAVARDEDNGWRVEVPRHYTAKAFLLPAGCLLFRRQVINLERECIQYIEQIVWKINIGLVDFVNQNDLPATLVNGLAQRPERKIGVDELRLHVLGVLGILQPPQYVQPIEQILRPRRTLYGDLDNFPKLLLGGNRVGKPGL